MKNINLLQSEPNRDHWIVKADTKRFGAQAIVFEGRFDTAIGFIGQNVFQTDAESYTDSTLRYVDTLGRLNAVFAAEFDAVFELVCGIPICLKGELPQ